MDKTEKQVLRNERKSLRRSVKRDGSIIGFSLLLYVILARAVDIVWRLVGLEAALDGIRNLAEREKAYHEFFDSVEKQGVTMIIGVLLGLAVLFLLFLKRGTHKDIFRREETLPFGRFVCILCVFFGSQLIFQFGYILIETGLNAIGYSAFSSMKNATAGSTTLSMFLYVGLIGPVVEELVFRGFVMRALEKHGKMLAIVVSALLFGLMHANIPQSIFAVVVGLILGYVAMRYSIVWSIALHILNNLIFGDLLTWAISGLSEMLQIIVSYAVMGVFFVAGLIIFIFKGKNIRSFISENRTERPKLRWVLTSVGIVLFTIANLWLAILRLHKIGV